MYKENFYRRELKFLISYSTYLSLADTLQPFMKADSFGTDGKYKISSLYFDSNDDKIYWETSNKLPIRQKLRLRVYNSASIHGTAFFEVKQKVNNWVHKRRTVLTLAEGYRWMEKWSENDVQAEHFNSSNIQVAKEIQYFQRAYGLEPKVIVEYDRHAMEGIYDEDLRVTFDGYLRCRGGSLRLEQEEPFDYFVSTDFVIMEVKASRSVPLWLSRMLSEFRCLTKGVSKYCTSVNQIRGETKQNGLYS